MSSWPLTSPSKPAGSRPPMRSAPAMSAAARRSGAPASVVDAALRERDDLNVDPVAKGLAHCDHRFEIVEADVIVDVDVAARARRAVGDQRADERRRAGLDRQGDAMALDALGGDALTHAASLDMGQARGAPMGLVEMDVAFDERRQEQHPAEIEAVGGRRRCPRRVGGDDDAARDLDVGKSDPRAGARWPGSSDEVQPLRRGISDRAGRHNA